MSIGYGTQKDLVNSSPMRRWSQMTSYSNPAPVSRTAKTLTTVGSITVASALGSPPVAENCLEFTQTTTSYIRMDYVNANWAATSQNATDGGLNGKIWQGVDGQFTYEYSYYYNGTFPGQMNIFQVGAYSIAIGTTGSFTYFGIDGVSYNFQTSYSFVANTWYTIAYTRYFLSGQAYLACWINGVYQNTTIDTKDWTPVGAPVPQWAGPAPGAVGITGQMQEIRMSNIARYTAGVNYTVPTTPFVNDNNTILLINGPAGVVDNNT